MDDLRQQYLQKLAEIKEQKNKTTKNEGWTGFLLSIVFSLSLVATVAFGLHAIENVINNKSFIKVAQAAEVVYKTSFPGQTPGGTINIKPGDSITITLKYQNLGNTAWDTKSVYLKSSTTAFKYIHKSWPDAYVPARMKETTVAPQGFGTFSLVVQAPKNFGLQSGEFMLVANNVVIPGGEIAINLNVVADPSAVVTPLATNTSASEPIAKMNYCGLKLNIASVTDQLDNVTCAEKFSLSEKGPDVKVGIFYTDKSISIKNSAAWQIYDESDMLLASVPPETEITIFYSKTKSEYAFDFIDHTVHSAKYLRLRNFNNGVFAITNFKDIPSWNKSLNYNQFIGTLEIKYNNAKDRVWVVETLPLEDYLKGMKETSDSDNFEYLKAMTVAARTYALYNVNKLYNSDSFFDLYSTDNDQVYKGYASTRYMPNLSRAVEETKGIIASYDNQVIVAYYSARSGGQTVNYKNVPYLRSVATPYSAPYGKWGHGIGIDAWDAKARAEKEGASFDQILKYYYQGIKLEKIY